MWELRQGGKGASLMPPKTVTCAVCQQEVLKAQTLARKDGSRACRTHEGVQQEAQALHVQEQQRRAKETVPHHSARRCAALSKGYRPTDLERGQHVRDVMEEGRKLREWAYSHCWTCGAEGISLREHFAQCLIAQKRLQLRGEWNFLTLPQDMAKLMGPQVVLAMLPYDDRKDEKLRRLLTNRKIKDLIHFLRTIHMCITCIDKHGVRDRLEALLPKPTWEQLEAFMPVTALLDPLITEMAEKKENEN